MSTTVILDTGAECLSGIDGFRSNVDWTEFAGLHDACGKTTFAKGYTTATAVATNVFTNNHRLVGIRLSVEKGSSGFLSSGLSANVHVVLLTNPIRTSAADPIPIPTEFKLVFPVSRIDPTFLANATNVMSATSETVMTDNIFTALTISVNNVAGFTFNAKVKPMFAPEPVSTSSVKQQSNIPAVELRSDIVATSTSTAVQPSQRPNPQPQPSPQQTPNSQPPAQDSVKSSSTTTSSSSDSKSISTFAPTWPQWGLVVLGVVTILMVGGVVITLIRRNQALEQQAAQQQQQTAGTAGAEK